MRPVHSPAWAATNPARSPPGSPRARWASRMRRPGRFRRRCRRWPGRGWAGRAARVRWSRRATGPIARRSSNSRRKPTRPCRPTSGRAGARRGRGTSLAPVPRSQARLRARLRVRPRRRSRPASVGSCRALLLRRVDDRPVLLPAARAGGRGGGLRHLHRARQHLLPAGVGQRAIRTPPTATREFLEDKPFLEPFSLIPRWAPSPTKLRFSTFVVKLPIRHPVLVAKQAASVAVLTDEPLHVRRRHQPVARGLRRVPDAPGRDAASAWTR